MLACGVFFGFEENAFFGAFSRNRNPEMSMTWRLSAGIGVPTAGARNTSLCVSLAQDWYFLGLPIGLCAVTTAFLYKTKARLTLLSHCPQEP